MDVESVEARGKSLDLGVDLDLLALNLGELDDSGDTGATIGVHDGDSVVSFRVDHLYLDF